MAYGTTTDSRSALSRFDPKDTPKLRIGILSYRSDPRTGGQGVYLDYLSRALQNAGHDVTILSGPPYPAVDPGVKVVRVPSLDLYAQPHKGHRAFVGKVCGTVHVRPAYKKAISEPAARLRCLAR